MKIKKILIYITAAAAAVTMASSAYAEDEAVMPLMEFDEETGETAPEPEESGDTSESTSFEPITLPIVSDTSDTDTSEPPEDTSSDVAVVDPIEFEDPTDDTTSEDPTESTESSEENTTEPDISWEDTTSAPEISLDTTPEPVTDPPTEASTAAPTEPPATNPTEASSAEPVALDTQPSAVTTVSEATPATSENDTTTPPPVLTTPSNFDNSNMAGVDPAGSDDLLTTILWIVAGVLAFVIILILPPVIRKIRKNIIYKYD